MVECFPEDADGFVDKMEQQIRAYIFNVMPPDPSGELNTLPLTDLLLVYGNWRSRFVNARPRAVHFSNKLRSSPHAATHRAALDAISACVQAGDDLTPYLSRRIKTAYVPQAQRNKPLHRLPDLDLLISDWGLHHLHLSTQVEPDGFVERTDDLLFAAFTHQDAYFIGIHPHGNWTRQELIEVLVREWPNNSAVIASVSGLTLASSVSEDDHLQLRNAGVATLMQVDGKVVIAGQGMTTAGTAMRVTSHVDNVTRVLAHLRGSLGAELSALESQYPVPEGGTATWTSWVDDDTCWLRRGEGRVLVADLTASP